MAEIRRLEAGDIPQLHKMHTVVYNLKSSYPEEKETNGEVAIDPLDHPAHWACGVFEGTKLLAGMYETDFLMRFDWNSVKMSGIGGVGTLPEARKDGHIKRIFEKLLPEEYENGVVFSNLTPFSHDFYRNFGYEIASGKNEISIPITDLPEIKRRGQFLHIFPGDDTSGLAEVHNAYISGINHGIHRDYWPDNRAWKSFTRADPYSTGKYLYLWKDEKGKARSYIKFEDIKEDDDHNMNVREIAFVDMKGLYAILGFAADFSAQFENFKWEMPAFLDPCDFSTDAWSVEMKFNPREMTRVVNVKTALELMRRPCFEGEYVIGVEDNNLAVNSGKYLVEFGHNGSKVTKTSREPDISCDIKILNQLVTGYRSLENAMYSRREGLEIHGNVENLKSVFSLRPQHVTEYF